MPTPRRTAFSAPIAFAQKPSSFPSSSACAAATPNDTPGAFVPGTPTMRTPSRSRSTPASISSRLSPSLTSGAAPMLRPLTALTSPGVAPGPRASPAASTFPAPMRRGALPLAIAGRRERRHAPARRRNRRDRRAAPRTPCSWERSARARPRALRPRRNQAQWLRSPENTSSRPDPAPRCGILHARLLTETPVALFEQPGA